MKSMIVNLVVGASLFAAALLGSLAVTGRLSHDGVKGIPLLETLFPAGPADAAADPHDAGAHDAGNGTEATGDRHGPGLVDAGHDADVQEPGRRSTGPQPLRRGRSLFTGEDGGAGGHGETDATESHDDLADASTTAHEPQGPRSQGSHPPSSRAPAPTAGDQASPQGQGYAPGGYYRFDGMPAGITPDQLNDAWRRVQDVVADLEKRGQALDLREKSLREFADDISRRQTELGRERVEIENLHRRLDERIELFQQQVKMVRTDEVAGLKRNAQTLASFEPSKAAELITEQWKLESGQDEVLKVLEFMDRESVNSILEVLPNPMVRDVLQKRLKVSKESMPSAPLRR